MIALHIDAGSGRFEEKEYEFTGPVELGVKINLKKQTYSSEKPVFVMGKGLLTDLGLPGTHRLTFVFKSPMTGALHVSTLGGAAWHFKRTGIDAVVIEGQSEEVLFIGINGSGKGYEVELKTMSFENYERLARRGLRALSEHVAEMFPFSGRSIIAGLAAFTTPFGSVYSAEMKNGKVVEGSEDYAARGGSGSALAFHNVAAIAFGGVAKPLKLNEEAKKAVEEANQKPYMQAILDATVKYRYDPKLKTGGTFGGNYPHLQIYTPMFNFNMIYMSKEEREKLWKELMGPRWWAKFNREVIEPRAFKTCGEPCPVACKKVWKGIKLDYEPLEACGPLSWIFDLDAAADLAHTVDELGYDAIEFGSTLAWVLDAIKQNKLLGDKIGFTGNWNSRAIAEFGKSFAEKLATSNEEIYRILREGKRRGGELLDQLFGEGIKDLAVYVAYGKEGYMTPTMYWAIGNFVPLPIAGRYWTYYKFAIFLEPEELAEKSFSRAVNELWLDNLGVCRFHRGWFEKAAEGIIKAAGIDVDLESKGIEILKAIVEYNSRAKALPQFWETKKVKDIIAIGAREFGNEVWAEKFEKNGESALREYWERFHEAFYSRLG